MITSNGLFMTFVLFKSQKKKENHQALILQKKNM